MSFFRIPLIVTLLASAALVPAAIRTAHADDAKTVTCPVSGKTFQDSADHKAVVVDGKRVAFCCPNCPAAFAANPEKYLKDDMLGKCLVQGGPNHVSSTSRVVLNNELNYFCCPGCDKAVAADPSKYVKTLTDVVSGKTFAPTADSPKSEYKSQIYLFASADNKATFDKNPTKYAVVYGPTKEATKAP